MKLTSEREVLAENKVLILYILNKIDKPINNDSLLKLVLSIVDMNYFYFQQFLLDLLESKYITTYVQDEIDVYAVTTLGRETLALTEDILPGILKLKVDSTLKGELTIVEEAMSISAEFIPQDENNFTVKCKIIENNSVMFEVQTFAGSREQAKAITDNWKENATDIYPKIIDLLNK